MKNNKVLGLIGLSMKAGKVCFGSDVVEENIIKRKVKIVIIANDSSERTKNKFINLSNQYNIPYIIEWDIDTLSKTIGKNNKAIIGIKDINFSNEIKKIYDGGEIIG